jgi:hypothetical protein
MIIRLYQPPTKNWLLVAEQLDDPPTWDRFVPCHTTQSQRWQFECAVKEKAAENGLKLQPCKEMLCCGLGVFEYDWNSNDDDILSHAMLVAESFGLELAMESPAGTYSAA